MNSLWLAFITGLTTGGITCLMVQGGLLSSSVAETNENSSKWKSTGMFLMAKLVAYTLLGAGLGFLGSRFLIRPTTQGWLQIFAGLFMLATAARLLELHPALRYLVIQPPRWALRLARNQTQAKTIFTPGILGFLTVLIPCGVTQAMMALAVSSGNPFSGAGVMFAFTLGTSPVFFALGLATVKLLEKKAFAYLAAFVIATLGFWSVNTGQTLRGSVHTLQNYYWAITDTLGASKEISAKVAGISAIGAQEVTIEVLPRAYSASATTLQSGIPVKLNLKTQNVFGCTRSFNISALKISKVLPATGEETIEFIPTQKGRLVYTCSMGMYSGYFDVI